MTTLYDKFWITQLDEEAARRRDQRSFHAFAEGQHSDIRGQIYNLAEGAELALPEGWAHHLLVVIGIEGSVDAYVEGRCFLLRAQTQLVLPPGIVCKLRARSVAAFELISVLSMPPRPPG